MINQKITGILFSICLIFLGGAAVAEAAVAEPGYGYIAIFAETLATPSTCSAAETEFDFQTKEFLTEAGVVPQDITVSILNNAGSVLRTTSDVSGTGLTDPICVDLLTQKVSVKVIGGASYHDFAGVYTLTDNAAAWKGKRVRSHVHLESGSQGKTVEPVTPARWYQVQPTLDLAVRRLTPLHGATALDSIMVYADSVKKFENVSNSGGTGTYSVNFSDVLPEGWQSWGFYVGLNGGSPDPISAWSGFTQFGIDKAGPVNRAETKPKKTTFSEDETFIITATSTDLLSGVSNIQILIDGVLSKECDFGVVAGAQGKSREVCTTDVLGPFPTPGMTHTYTVISRDSAGNLTESDTDFVIACQYDSQIFGNNPGQFRGCFYNYQLNAYINVGNTPAGPAIPSFSSSTLALDLNFGTSSPVAGARYMHRHVATFTFEPGEYTFYVEQPSGSGSAGFNFYEEGGGYFSSNRIYESSGTFNKEYTATTKVTVAATFYVDGAIDPGDEYAFRFGWKPALCNELATGVNQALGCMYNDSYRSQLFATAPAGPVIDPSAVSNVAIDFDWGSSSPLPGISADNFSAVWKGSYEFKAGWYRFFAGNEEALRVSFRDMDGVGLVCSGAPVPSSFSTVYANTKTTGATNLTRAFYCEVPADGVIGIQMYFQKGAGVDVVGAVSRVSFGWARQGGALTFCDVSSSGVNQFTGCLYKAGAIALAGALPDGPNVTDPGSALGEVKASASASTSALSFDWGDGTGGTPGSPDPEFTGLDWWNARWYGTFTFAPGTYEFKGKAYSTAGIFMDGAYAGGLGTNYSTFTKTFATTTEVSIQISYWAYTGPAYVDFGWKLAPPSYTVAPLGHGGAGIFPGESPVGEYIHNYAGGWALVSDNDTNPFTRLDNVNSVTLYGNGLYISPSSGGFPQTAYIEVRDADTGTWERVWQRDVTAGSYFDRVQAFFSSRSIDRVNVQVDTAGGMGGSTGSGIAFGFGSPDVPPGFGFEVTSFGGYEGEVFVDTGFAFPPQLTKTTGWGSNSCFVPKFGSCTIRGLNVVTSDGSDGSNPYVDYPIQFVATDSILNRGIDVLLKVWGFESTISPAFRGLAYGTGGTYTVSVESKNGWYTSSSLLLSALSIDPVEPTISLSLSAPSLTVLAGGTATADIDVMTSNVTPQGTSTIAVNLSANNYGGPKVKTATTTLFVSDVPIVSLIPLPDITLALIEDLAAPGDYKLTMDTVGAVVCRWNRSSSFGGDWTNVLVPDALPDNLRESNLQYESDYVTYPVGTATWTFACDNSEGATATSSISLAFNSDPAAVLTTNPATSCEVPDGAGSCVVDIDWSFSNASTTYLVKNIVTGTTYYTGSVPSGSDTDTFAVEDGLNRIWAYHNNGTEMLEQVSFIATCKPGSSVNPATSLCQITPPTPVVSVVADPKFVRSGDVADIAIQVNSDQDLNCVVTGVNTVGSPADAADDFIHLGFSSSTLSTIKVISTRPLYNKQEVTVDCSVIIFPSISSASSDFVEVIGTMEEI